MKTPNVNQTNLNFEHIWLLFQETDKKFQETDKILKEKFQETDKKIKELSNLFTTQWGKLIEAMVEPPSVKMFQDRGIKIVESARNIISQRKGYEMELDVLLVNSTELVVIEVKTTFKTTDTNEFMEKMKKFKKAFPHYKNLKVYGAVAALKYERDVDKDAYRKGLFVIKATGEGLMKIANDKKFIPAVY